MLPPHPDERQAAQTRSSKLVDLVVIGGGINGSGIAVDAAGRGLSVLLCEQHDLAAHTSSASSKSLSSTQNRATTRRVSFGDGQTPL